MCRMNGELRFTGSQSSVVDGSGIGVEMCDPSAEVRGRG